MADAVPVAAPTSNTPDAAPESDAPVGQGGAPNAAKAAPMPKGGLSKQLGEAPPEAEAKPEAPSKRKYKLKVDGQDFEEELGDDEVAVRLQKEHAWRKRQGELAGERKKIEQFYELGKKDWKAAAKQLWGVDALQLSQEELATQYRKDLELQKLKPEERVKLEYEEKLAAKQAEFDAVQKQIQDKETEALEQRVFKETETRFINALLHEGLPKSHETIAEMAKVARMAHDEGYQLSEAQLAAEVRNRIEAREDKLHKAVLGGLKGEELLKRFPAEVTKEIVRAVLARSKAAATPAPSAPIKRAPPAAPRQDTDLTPGQRRKQRLGLL